MNFKLKISNYIQGCPLVIDFCWSTGKRDIYFAKWRSKNQHINIIEQLYNEIRELVVFDLRNLSLHIDENVGREIYWSRKWLVLEQKYHETAVTF